MTNLLKYFIFAGVLWGTATVYAAEIPTYVGLKDTQSDICGIINNMVSPSEDSQVAINEQRRQDSVLQEDIAALYAEALTTRASVTKAAADKAKEKAVLKPKVDDKKTMLEYEVQERMRNIAERLNSIISLEASRARLEGDLILYSTRVSYEEGEPCYRAPAETAESQGDSQ